MKTVSATPGPEKVPPRNGIASIVLLLAAWALYLASLALPAVELQGSTEPGWCILLLVLNPHLWLLPWIFGYCLVNVSFWVSPFMLPMRRLQGKALTHYPVLLVVAAIAGWASWFLVARVSYGYFAWATSLTLAAIAFWLPMEGTTTTDPSPAG